MSQKTKIGIIGCGAIGTTHANAYAAVDNAEVVALCDILPDRLAEKAKLHPTESRRAQFKLFISAQP